MLNWSAFGWFGLIAPADTPKEIVPQVNRDLIRIFQLDEVKGRLLELAAESAALTPDTFRHFIRQDNAKWAKLIRERGLVIE